MFDKIIALFERLVVALEKLATGGSAVAASTTTPSAGPTKPARGKAAAKDPTPPVDELDLDAGGAGDEDFLGTSEPEKKFTRDDVRAALIDHGKRHKDPALARGVLKQFGKVEILAELKEELFAKVVAEAAK